MQPERSVLRLRNLLGSIVEWSGLPRSSKIAYEEGLRGLSEQQHALESIRGRAASNIAIVSLAASLLGPEVLGTVQRDCLGVALLAGAAICFVISISLSVFVLKSGTGWIFTQSPGQILRDYRDNKHGTHD